jgi:hypothetical protein
MAEGDRIDHFLRGLKPDIHERVALQGPTTLNQACNLANTIDTIRYQIRNFGSARSYSSPNSSTSGSTPMEIDSIRRTKLSDQDQEHLRKIGGCFFCREVGHMSRNCLRKKKKNLLTSLEVEGFAEEESGKGEAE